MTPPPPVFQVEGQIKIQRVALALAKSHGISVRLLRSTNRKQNVADVRSLVAYLLTEHHNMRDDVVAKFFKRCRTTIVHNRRQTKERMETNARVREGVRMWIAWSKGLKL